MTQTTIATIVNEVLQGLNSDRIENQEKFGRITERLGEFGTATVAHFGGKQRPWDSQPRFFAVSSFYANGSLADVTSSKKGIAAYNSKNEEKIHEFSTITELTQFIESLSSQNN